MKDYFMVMDDGSLHDTRKPISDGPLRPVYSYAFREIDTTQELKATLRAGPFIFPGGYELFFICADGGVLCHQCVKDNFRLICSTMWDGYNSDWLVTYTQHTSECDGPIICDHCSRTIVEGWDND